MTPKQFIWLLRWLAFIPLIFIWVIFTFVIAGYSFSALVALLLMGILLFYNVTSLLMPRFPIPIKALRGVFTVILCIGLLICGVTEIFIIKASFGDLKEQVDYVVVLGAKVREDGPSVSLQNRIDGAYRYLSDHPQVIAVVTGGMGPDEPMTEARCMRDCLVDMGIDPSRIWMEEKATSTWENLHFSLDLIEEKTGIRPKTAGIVSSEYHIFRAGLIAKSQNLNSAGIPAATTWLSLRVNYFLREIVAVWYYILLGG